MTISAPIVAGALYQNRGRSFLGRIADENGALLLQANVSALAYSVLEWPTMDVVTGHENVAMVVAEGFAVSCDMG